MLFNPFKIQTRASKPPLITWRFAETSCLLSLFFRFSDGVVEYENNVGIASAFKVLLCGNPSNSF